MTSATQMSFNRLVSALLGPVFLLTACSQNVPEPCSGVLSVSQGAMPTDALGTLAKHLKVSPYAAGGYLHVKRRVNINSDLLPNPDSDDKFVAVRCSFGLVFKPEAIRAKDDILSEHLSIWTSDHCIHPATDVEIKMQVFSGGGYTEIPIELEDPFAINIFEDVKLARKDSADFKDLDVREKFLRAFNTHESSLTTLGSSRCKSFTKAITRSAEFDYACFSAWELTIWRTKFANLPLTRDQKTALHSAKKHYFSLKETFLGGSVPPAFASNVLHTIENLVVRAFEKVPEARRLDSYAKFTNDLECRGDITSLMCREDYNKRLRSLAKKYFEPDRASRKFGERLEEIALGPLLDVKQIPRPEPTGDAAKDKAALEDYQTEKLVANIFGFAGFVQNIGRAKDQNFVEGIIAPLVKVVGNGLVKDLAFDAALQFLTGAKTAREAADKAVNFVHEVIRNPLDKVPALYILSNIGTPTGQVSGDMIQTQNDVFKWLPTGQSWHSRIESRESDGIRFFADGSKTPSYSPDLDENGKEVIFALRRSPAASAAGYKFQKSDSGAILNILYVPLGTLSTVATGLGEPEETEGLVATVLPKSKFTEENHAGKFPGTENADRLESGEGTARTTKTNGAVVGSDGRGRKPCGG